MKKQFRKLLIVSAFLGGFFLLPDGAFAQPGGGGGPGGDDDPGCWPPPCVPIDGGVGWLVAAGALYGGRKAYKSSQKDSENE